MKQLNEVARMQQLAGINEIEVNNPVKFVGESLLKWCEKIKKVFLNLILIIPILF